jgi:HEAT repeat protein
MNDKRRTQIDTIIKSAEALLSEATGPLTDGQRKEALRIHEAARRFLAVYDECASRSRDEAAGVLRSGTYKSLTAIRMSVVWRLGPHGHYAEGLDKKQAAYIQTIRDNVQLLLDWIAGPNEELFQKVLSAEDDEVLWQSVHFLQLRGTREVFERAKTLCQSENPGERRLGVDVLAQFGLPERFLHGEIFALFAQMLKNETDADVLRAIGVAFSHREDRRAIKLLTRLKDHPDWRVRYGVVWGITGHEDELAVEALIELSTDHRVEVRDWATFGLGVQVDTDTEAVRQALFDRLEDEDEIVRGEALRGLAGRGDDRVVDALVEEMATGHEDPWQIADLILEAAAAIGDPRLHKPLLTYRRRLTGEDSADEYFEEAIEACKPREV